MHMQNFFFPSHGARFTDSLALPFNGCMRGWVAHLAPLRSWHGYNPPSCPSRTPTGRACAQPRTPSRACPCCQVTVELYQVAHPPAHGAVACHVALSAHPRGARCACMRTPSTGVFSRLITYVAS